LDRDISQKMGGEKNDFAYPPPQKQFLKSRIVSTHPYTTPQAIPQADYERNPSLASW